MNLDLSTGEIAMLLHGVRCIPENAMLYDRTECFAKPEGGILWIRTSEEMRSAVDKLSQELLSRDDRHAFLKREQASA